MSWRFRKSFKVLPGVRLNVSKRGVSTSIGLGPFTVNVGPRGVHGTASVPGTGVSIRHRIDQPATQPSAAPASAAAPRSPQPATPDPLPAGIDLGEEIRSAGTDLMTSAGLAQFRNLLLQAGKECVTLTAEIAVVTLRANETRSRQQRWERGFLFRRIRRTKFARICEEADTAEAQLSELQEQLRLGRLATEIIVEPDIAVSYSRLCDTFTEMTQSKRIWDTLTRKATNRAAERTAASASITREPVIFRRGQSDILSCEWEVPCLENRSGGDMYLYPAFVLYRVASDTFAVIDVQEVTIEFVPTKFMEEEAIPADSPIVGQTWLKANKDGSPDKRFKDNVQIPIVEYGTLKLRSGTGLNEEYMLSSAPLCEDFAKAWTTFRKSFASPKPIVATGEVSPVVPGEKGERDHDELEEQARQEQLGRRWEWVHGGNEDAPAFIGASVKLEDLGSFDFEIVGESRYQENLWQIAHVAHPEYGARVVEPACLVLEDENPSDSNAVRVDMMSLPVGYLSRDKAVWYRRMLSEGRVPTTCHGRIRGGFPRDGGGKAYLGVKLDLEASRAPRKRKV